MFPTYPKQICNPRLFFGGFCRGGMRNVTKKGCPLSEGDSLFISQLLEPGFP